MGIINFDPRQIEKKERTKNNLTNLRLCNEKQQQKFVEHTLTKLTILWIVCQRAFSKCVQDKFYGQYLSET